ncbi:PLP-dependent aminotransferase family protein [Methylophaga sp. OBS3]|uniref:aminotransferase-like domain-containing protein n=1 Tax=Methylophaga sp. OBS3 TaxID=2991934 RepID=UPI002254CF1E|nr:PLP-dependent aminotransferase family protein [Methylophaga sp. OBS3]MCX4189237.1 PLP-dependent aminotransferase family protein [Methylophaga sp. OBS3]
MTEWQPHIIDSARVKYIGVVEALESDIKNRVVKPGDRLPPQRQIANSLGIDLTTVTRAMKEAARRGLIEAQTGSGTFIAQTAFSHYSSTQLIKGKPLDLSMNNPSSPLDIKVELEIDKSLQDLAAVSTKPLHHLSYQETAGHPEDRAAAKLWLSQKLPDINADNVLITSGAHSAIYSILSHFKRLGVKSIVAPELCYPGFISIADQLGLDVFSVEMDASGIVPDALSDIIHKYHPDALYLTPNIDNPTTATLTLDRRMDLAELAKHHQLKIIEDDPYYAFLDESLPAFYSLAPELTWHIATTSKCLAPALRVAYVVAPEVSDILALTEEIRVSSIMAPPLMSAVVANWIRSGRINAISQAVKAENIKRQQLAASIFKRNALQTHHAAPHFWLPLAKGMRALDFSEQAKRVGVSVVPSTAFVSTRSHVQAVRVSLGGPCEHAELSRGLSLLAELYDSKLPTSKFII